MTRLHLTVKNNEAAEVSFLDIWVCMVLESNQFQVGYQICWLHFYPSLSTIAGEVLYSGCDAGFVRAFSCVLLGLKRRAPGGAM